MLQKHNLWKSGQNSETEKTVLLSTGFNKWPWFSLVKCSRWHKTNMMCSSRVNFFQTASTYLWGTHTRIICLCVLDAVLYRTECWTVTFLTSQWLHLLFWFSAWVRALCKGSLSICKAMKRHHRPARRHLGSCSPKQKAKTVPQRYLLSPLV